MLLTIGESRIYIKVLIEVYILPFKVLVRVWVSIP